MKSLSYCGIIGSNLNRYGLRAVLQPDAEALWKSELTLCICRKKRAGLTPNATCVASMEFQRMRKIIVQPIAYNLLWDATITSLDWRETDL